MSLTRVGRSDDSRTLDADANSRNGLSRRRMRRGGDGLRRFTHRSVPRRRRHGRPAARARRALARGVSVRAPAPALRVLRRELAAARQRDDRPPRTERGIYERASAAEICAYYDRVMQSACCLPGGSATSRCATTSATTGSSRACPARSVEVKVRKKLVDATYLEASRAGELPPPFDVAPGAYAACRWASSRASPSGRPAT